MKLSELALPSWWPAIAVLLVLAIGFGTGWHFGSGHYRAQYEALTAADWQSQAQAKDIALKAVQTQLENAHAAIIQQTGVINDLDQKRAATAAERDRNLAALERLRRNPSQAAAGTRAVPEAAGQCGTAQACPTAELAECQRVLINSVAESADNADALDALVSAIKPQLSP